MREDRRSRYDEGFRREALALIWIGYKVLDGPMRDE